MTRRKEKLRVYDVHAKFDTKRARRANKRSRTRRRVCAQGRRGTATSLTTTSECPRQPEATLAGEGRTTRGHLGRIAHNRRGSHIARTQHYQGPTGRRRHRPRVATHSGEQALTTTEDQNRRSPIKRRQKKRMTKRQVRLPREALRTKRSTKQNIPGCWVPGWGDGALALPSSVPIGRAALNTGPQVAAAPAASASSARHCGPP